MHFHEYNYYLQPHVLEITIIDFDGQESELEGQ